LFTLRWKGSTTGGFSIDIIYRKGKEHVPQKIEKLTYFRVKTMVSCRLSLKSTYITIIHNPCPKYQLSASGPPKINPRIYLSNTKLWFPMVLGRGGKVGQWVCHIVATSELHENKTRPLHKIHPRSSQRLSRGHSHSSSVQYPSVIPLYWLMLYRFPFFGWRDAFSWKHVSSTRHAGKGAALCRDAPAAQAAPGRVPTKIKITKENWAPPAALKHQVRSTLLEERRLKSYQGLLGDLC
jgi:hypothetical protein